MSGWPADSIRGSIREKGDWSDFSVKTQGSKFPAFCIWRGLATATYRSRMSSGTKRPISSQKFEDRPAHRHPTVVCWLAMFRRTTLQCSLAPIASSSVIHLPPSFQSSDMLRAFSRPRRASTGGVSWVVRNSMIAGSPCFRPAGHSNPSLFRFAEGYPE